MTIRPQRCDRAAVEDDVTRVDVAPFGWAYFVAGDFELACGPDEVVVRQTGLTVSVRTIDPTESEVSPEDYAAGMLEAVARRVEGRDVQTTDVVVVGERGRPARCSRFRFQGEQDIELVMVMCVGWIERADDQAHMIMVAASDYEEVWTEEFGGDIATFGGLLIDNFIAGPVPPEPAPGAVSGSK